MAGSGPWITPKGKIQKIMDCRDFEFFLLDIKQWKKKLSKWAQILGGFRKS